MLESDFAEMQLVQLELRRSKARVLVELLTSTFLLSYWFFSMHRYIYGTVFSLQLLFVVPIVLNAFLWFFWMVSSWFDFLRSRRRPMQAQLYFVERSIGTLMALQFIFMTIPMILIGLGYVRL